MKILIAYSSMTGNTKTLCEGVYNALKEHHDVVISDVKNAPDYKDFDFIIPGFWADRGTANKEARKFIEDIREKYVLLLGTLGADPSSEHGDHVRENTEALVDSSNKFLGVFIARGKVSEKLIKRLKFLPVPKHVREQMYEASINSRETNEEDVKNAIDFIKEATASMHK